MNQYNNKMNALEKLLKTKELFKKEIALRDEALEALQEYNRGKCRDNRLWDRYIELSKAADLKQKEAEELK
jgi:hypothetical protein